MALTVDQQQKSMNNAFNAPGVEVADLTVSDIENVAPPVTNPYQRQIYDTIDRYSRRLPALPNATYYPAAQNNIAKGTYSGPTTGTSTAYVESGLIPFGVYGARNQQIEAAARAKAKSQSEFFKLMKAPQTTRFSVQADLDEQYFKGLNQWMPVLQQRYGSNWGEAGLQDPQFLQWDANMRTVAKYNDGMMENAARIEALADDPLFVVHPATLAANRAMVAGAGGLFEPTPFGQASNTDFAKQLLQAKAETDLDVAINTATKEFADKEYTTHQGSYSNGIYDVWSSWANTGMTDDQLESLTDSIWINAYGGHSDIFTKEIIKERLRDIYPQRAKKELQFQTNQFASSGGNEVVYPDSVINPEGEDITWGTSGTDDNGNPINDQVTTYDGQTFDKPINLNVPNSTRAVDPATGTFVDIPGNSKITVGKTANVLVDGQGNIVSKNKASAALTTGSSYQTYAFATYSVSEPEMQDVKVYKKDAKGNATSEVDHIERSPTGKYINTQKTVMIPAAQISSGLAQTDSNGKVTKGARLDIQKQNADQRNKAKAAQQSNKPIPAPQPRPGEKPAAPGGSGNYLINGKNYTNDELLKLGYSQDAINSPDIQQYLRK